MLARPLAVGDSIRLRVAAPDALPKLRPAFAECGFFEDDEAKSLLEREIATFARLVGSPVALASISKEIDQADAKWRGTGGRAAATAWPLHSCLQRQRAAAWRALSRIAFFALSHETTSRTSWLK
jgi:hypothetical protein